MKLALLLAVGLVVLPPLAEAQVELGFDAGMTVDRTLGNNVTTVLIPSSMLRVGFFPGQTIAFESLVSFATQRFSGQTATAIRFLPGIVYNWRPNTYFRGEAGMLLIDDSSTSATQFAFGIGVGTRRQIGPGPLYFRVEVALDQWRENSDFFAHSESRFLAGISIVLN